MRTFDIIKKKRDGLELSQEEINFIISGAVDGSVPDYQVSAFLMAVYFKGMSVRETRDLTFAIRDSGPRLDFTRVNGLRVDKHSTGGVGDKTSLVVCPIVASLGLKVAKMSGRGLGHTGGTIDKLLSIPGFDVDIEEEKFIDIVNKTGIAIVGQSKGLAPADKILYALRDVTATIDSLPLIVSSIMGKKLCADDDVIVLDVKCGSGAFMKTVEQAEELASAMVEIGKSAGKRVRALITDMDVPLGSNIGNALEVIEAVETLKGRGSDDFEEICLALASHILELSGKGTYENCYEMAKDSIKSGKALAKLKEMVVAQGGDVSVIDDVSLFEKATISHEVLAEKEGYIRRIDTEAYGVASLTLGAGRNVQDDPIDYSAGIVLCKKTGDKVSKGDVLATLYTNNAKSISGAEKIILSATEIGDKKENTPLIIKVIG